MKHVKRLAILCLALIISLSGAACSTAQNGAQDGGALSVYLVKTDALYTDALGAYQKSKDAAELTITEFESYSALDSRLNTELMSGKGPDVLLFNAMAGSFDVLKLASGGAFLPLNEQVSSLPADTYFAPVLEAGKIGGTQYLIPLSWNIIQAYSREGLMAERGYSGDADFFETIAAEGKALEGQEDMAFCSVMTRRRDPLNEFLEAAGVSVTDENGKLAIDEAGLRRVADFVRLFYTYRPQMRAVSQKYSNDFAGATAHMSFLVEDYPFLNNLRYYQSVYPNNLSEEAVLLPAARSDGGFTAQVVCFGAVNANTASPESAFALLRAILDAPCNMDFSKYDENKAYYAPVNASVYEECVKHLESKSGPGPKGKVSPLNAENAALLREVPGRIRGAVIPNASIGALLEDCFGPYFKDEKGFEECFSEFKNKAALYLDE